MLICEICGQSFKNKSGLSGHRRLAHHLDSSPTASAEVGDTSESGQIIQEPWQWWRDHYERERQRLANNDGPSVVKTRQSVGLKDPEFQLEERLGNIETRVDQILTLVVYVSCALGYRRSQS